MAAEAQHQVELRRADFQQQVGVAGEAGDQAFVGFADVQHDRACRRGFIRDGGAAGIANEFAPTEVRALLTARLGQRACGVDVDRHEANLVAGLELAELPQVGVDDGHRADEAAEARAVRAEDHRHIAGEVHRADGVGVVVDVRRVQAGFAAALAHPFRFRADQPHAGAAGVEVHFPGGGEEGLDVAFGEVFRGAVRAVDHADLAYRRQRFAELGGQAGAAAGIAQRRKVQHVAGAQRAAAVATELAEGEGALAAEVVRHLQAAAQGQVRPRARAGDGAEAQGAAGLDRQRGVQRLGEAIHAERNRRAGDRDHRIGVEAQGRPAHGDFQAGGAFLVAEQTVAEAQRAVVHRPRRRHADRPVAEAAGVILHGGLGAGGQHFEGVGPIDQVFQAAGPRRAAGERRVDQDLPQVVAVGFHAVQHRVGQRLAQRGAGLGAARRPGDELGDHRVEVGRNLAAGFDPGVDAQRLAVGLGEVDGGEQARARLEVAARVFGVQACLDRVAAGLQVFCQFGQRWQIAGRQFDHPAHQVDAPDLFGDAVLDLQAGVHFEEVEALGLAVVDELDGAGAAVADRLGQLDRRRAQFLGHAGRQVRRRGFLQHLLVAALHRAVAYAEGQHLALAVAEHLHFQVAGALDVLLDEHAGVAEVVLPEALDRLEGIRQFLGRAAYAHADAATAGGAFQHHRVADLVTGFQCGGEVFQQFGAFQHRHAMLFRECPGGVLEAEYAQLLRGRADEGDASGLAGFGEGGVFGEEAVAGVNGGGAGLLGDIQNLVDHQVGAGGRAFAKAEGFIGLLDMQAGGVGFGVHRHALDVEGTQGAQDAAGNGAAVGDQEFVEHCRTLERDDGPSRLIRLHHGRPWLKAFIPSPFGRGLG
ncbi:hypothetical protein D9M69_300730 [compost metagenome]